MLLESRASVLKAWVLGLLGLTCNYTVFGFRVQGFRVQRFRVYGFRV